MNPKVSVIIPCYRQGRFLSQAVESALAQTYQPVEIVVVNDGSDDDTESVALSYGERIVYVSKPNGGHSSARNAGIARATGEFVLFLDADDLIHPDAISRLVGAMGVDGPCIAMMGACSFTADPKTDAFAPLLPPPVDRLLPWFFRENMPIHTFLCPREAILLAGSFDESFPAAEDWDLWLRLGLSGIRVVTVPWCGAFYRKYPGSYSSNRSRMNLAMSVVLSRLWPALQEHSEFWSAWAPVYLRTLYAVQRRCRILGLAEDTQHELARIIACIRSRGVRVEAQSPLVVRIRDRLPAPLGDWFEAVLLRACRTFRPSFYDSLTQ